MEEDWIKNDGKNADRLGGANDGLKASWRWGVHSNSSGKDRRRRPGQCCEAIISKESLTGMTGIQPDNITNGLGGIELKVTYWIKYYEASVELNGEMLCSHGPDSDEIDVFSLSGGPPLLTRIAAQKKAESLAREFTKLFNKALRVGGL